MFIEQFDKLSVESIPDRPLKVYVDPSKPFLNLKAKIMSWINSVIDGQSVTFM